MKYVPVKELSKPKLVVGEGIDEWNLFSAMLRHLQLDQLVEAEQYNGKSKIHDGIKAISKRPGFAKITSLAVTRDADFLPQHPRQCNKIMCPSRIAAPCKNNGLDN